MRFSRLYERTAEFRSRCKAFEFAVVAHTVIDLALEVRKSLSTWWEAEKPKMAIFFKKPQQLVLELNSIAQIPMFKAGLAAADRN